MQMRGYLNFSNNVPESVILAGGPFTDDISIPVKAPEQTGIPNGYVKVMPFADQAVPYMIDNRMRMYNLSIGCPILIKITDDQMMLTDMPKYRVSGFDFPKLDFIDEGYLNISNDTLGMLKEHRYMGGYIDSPVSIPVDIVHDEEDDGITMIKFAQEYHIPWHDQFGAVRYYKFMPGANARISNNMMLLSAIDGCPLIDDKPMYDIAKHNRSKLEILAEYLKTS